MRAGISELTLRRVSQQLYRPISQPQCGGCGLRDLQSASAFVMGRLEYEKSGIRDINKLVAMAKENNIIVSGIGCTGRESSLFDVKLTWHTTHGRAPAVATGIKLALQGTKEDKNVWVFGGDGDLWSIGKNHTISAAVRKQLGIKMICYDNFIYGMTSGQTGPTTPIEKLTSTAPFGNMQEPIDPIRIMMAIKPPFLAQAVISNHPEHHEQLKEILYQMHMNPGFGYTHVIGTCHTEFGKRNDMPVEFQLRDQNADNVIAYEEWEKLPPNEKEISNPLGIIYNQKPTDYTKSEEYLNYLDAIAQIDAEIDNQSKTEIIFKPYNPYRLEKRTTIRLGGIAGWGVIGAGEILMDAAAQAGLNVAARKEYEATQRGGDTAYDIIMSEGDIISPIVPFVDILTVLNQSALEKYKNAVSPDGLIIANVAPGFVVDTDEDPRIIASNMSGLLKDLSEKVSTNNPNLGLNILAGTITVGYTEAFNRETFGQAVMQSRVGKKNPPLNEAALNAGFNEADRLLIEYPKN